ncbi:MAG: amidohydrolase [Chloroflexi bacterium]|nr:amidohydrolase [Chloroflexota bacterium]
MSRLLLKNGYILDPPAELVQSDILVDNDTIVDVASQIGQPRYFPGESTYRGQQTDRVINLSGKIVMPGLISAHTHTTSYLQRGIADNLPLEPWQFYKGLGELELTNRELYVTVALAAAELVKSGTTALLDCPRVDWADFDSQIDTVLQALVDVGIRVVSAPAYSDLTPSQTLPLHLLDRPSNTSLLDFGPPLESDFLARTLEGFLRRWQDRHPLVTPGLGPTGAHRCSEEMVDLTVELARRYDAPIQTHLLETKLQAVVSRAKFGGSTGLFLQRKGYLGPRVSFAHAVWVDDTDIQILAETGSSVVHNPLSNMRLGSGIAPVQRMRATGLNVALGADGGGCADNQNMIQVMKGAAFLGKLYGPRESWISALDAWDMCVRGGAKVMRRRVGRIAPGYLADLVALNMKTLFLMPRDNLLTQIVYSEPGSSVDTVMVGGRVLVEDGHLISRDVGELRAEAQDIVRRMYERVAARQSRYTAAKELLDSLATAVANQQLPFTRRAALWPGAGD